MIPRKPYRVELDFDTPGEAQNAIDILRHVHAIDSREPVGIEVYHDDGEDPWAPSVVLVCVLGCVLLGTIAVALKAMGINF